MVEVESLQSLRKVPQTRAEKVRSILRYIRRRVVLVIWRHVLKLKIKVSYTSGEEVKMTSKV
jgi:hypothetical protein